VNYQTFFICFFLIIAICMKLVAYLLEKYQNRNPDFRFVFLSPLLSTKSYQCLRDHQVSRGQLFLKAVIFGALMVMYYSSCYQVQNNLSPIGFSYLVAPGIYLITLWMSASLQLLFSLTGVIFSDMHDRPYLSISLTNFWGRRWNRWVRDWLNHLTYGLKSLNLKYAVMISFLISGLFHEIMFNLPYFIFTGKAYLGSMMVFFFLQGLGVLFEKSYLKNAPIILRRIFMFIMIIGLSPFFVQRPFLAIIGLAK